MEKIDLPLFYELGARLKALTEYKAEASNRLDIIIASLLVQIQLTQLFNKFPVLAFCRDTVQKLSKDIAALQEWMKNTPSEKYEGPNSNVDSKFQTVIDNSKGLEAILLAELQTLEAYHVTQKGIYSTTGLIERTENTLPTSTLGKIDSSIKDEIRRSGKCLAFDCATASAFHIMRATEMVMHKYYMIIRKPTSEKRLRNWGAYITELKKSSRSDVKEVVALLQQVKDQHRNLIMHPKAVLSPDEAFTLFEIAQAAIITMANQLPTSEESNKENKNAPG